MAVLTPAGLGAVLAAQAAALPQPDQLCGPFAAHVALHALLPSPPSVVDLALAAGTAVWPHDVPGWRPAGAALRTDGWDRLPVAAAPEASGTDAVGLAAGIGDLAEVAVVPAAGGGPASAWQRLLAGVEQASYDVGLVVNLLTDLGAGPVGHFAAVARLGGERVLLADSYAELTDPGEAPGCHWLGVGELAVAVALPPGRGVLMLVAPSDAPDARALVASAGLESRPWAT